MSSQASQSKQPCTEKVIVTCPKCNGSKTITRTDKVHAYGEDELFEPQYETTTVDCGYCNGTGKIMKTIPTKTIPTRDED